MQGVVFLGGGGGRGSESSYSCLLWGCKFLRDLTRQNSANRKHEAYLPDVLLYRTYCMMSPPLGSVRSAYPFLVMHNFILHCLLFLRIKTINRSGIHPALGYGTPLLVSEILAYQLTNLISLIKEILFIDFPTETRNIFPF